MTSEVPAGGDGARARDLSVGTKLALGIAAVVVALFVVVFLQISQRERQALVETKRSAATMTADLVATTLAAPLDFGDSDAIQVELDHVRQNRAIVGAVVWGADGAVVGQLADATPRPIPLVRTSRTVAGADEVEAVRGVVARGGKSVGGVALWFSLAAENAAYEASRARIFWLCVGLGVVTMALLVGLARVFIQRPLDELVRAVRRVERGEHDVTVRAKSRDEIGRLATAFNAMNAAITDREHRLDGARRELQELFDHMRQAIVVIGPDGKVRQTQSKEAARVFSEAAAAGDGWLAGVRAADLLYPGAEAWNAEVVAFGEWLTLAFATDPDDWSEVEALAPREVTLPGGRIVTLELRPIRDDDRVGRIMLLATDETDRRRFERRAREQGEEHARQLAAMRRLVVGGGQQFVGFLEGTRRRFATARQVALAGDASGRLDAAALRRIFQLVHTVKGEARAFDQGELASWMVALEERLAELRLEQEAAAQSDEADQAPASRPVGRARSEIVAGVDAAVAMLDGAERLFVEASPIGRAALEQTTVRRSDVDRLMKLTAGRDDEIGRIAVRLASRPLGEIAAPLVESAGAWAESAGKRATVEVEGRELLVPMPAAGVLPGVLTHLVRNAIAHGIEAPSLREAKGKPAAGAIRIALEHREGKLVSIVVEDDGVGADGPLAQAARERRALRAVDFEPARGEAAARASSPDASDLAGRKVGLPAVVAELATVGWEARVETREGKGSTFSLGPAPGPGA